MKKIKVSMKFKIPIRIKFAIVTDKERKGQDKANKK